MYRQGSIWKPSSVCWPGNLSPQHKYRPKPFGRYFLRKKPKEFESRRGGYQPPAYLRDRAFGPKHSFTIRRGRLIAAPTGWSLYPNEGEMKTHENSFRQQAGDLQDPLRGTGPGGEVYPARAYSRGGSDPGRSDRTLRPGRTGDGGQPHAVRTNPGALRVLAGRILLLRAGTLFLLFPHHGPQRHLPAVQGGRRRQYGVRRSVAGQLHPGRLLHPGVGQGRGDLPGVSGSVL